MDIWIEEDERFPDYKIHRDADWNLPRITVNEETLKRWNETIKKYNEIIREIGELVKDACLL